MSTYLNNQLVPATAAQFRTGLRQCLTPRSTFKGKTVADFFRNPATAITAPVPRSLVTFASAVGIRGTPKAPLHIAESVKDELVSSPLL